MSLLQMSVHGGIFILFIIALRAFTSRLLPKMTYSVLWAVAALRLLVPFSISSEFNICTLIGRLARSGESTVHEVIFPYTNEMPSDTARPYFVPMIWLAGAALLASFFVISYVKSIKKFKSSAPIESEFINEWLDEHKLMRPIAVRENEHIASPITYGVFRPVILLPKNMDHENSTLTASVLTHEYIHIRRFDGITKIIFAVSLCIHWFNPLVWIMYILANRDIELSCDAAVIRILGVKKRASYAAALLDMAEMRGGYSSLNSHFSRYAIEERIKSIVKYRKCSVVSALSAIVLIVLGTAVFATSPVAPSTNADEAIYDTEENISGDTETYTFHLITHGEFPSEDCEIQVMYVDITPNFVSYRVHGTEDLFDGIRGQVVYRISGNPLSDAYSSFTVVIDPKNGNPFDLTENDVTRFCVWEK